MRRRVGVGVMEKEVDGGGVVWEVGREKKERMWGAVRMWRRGRRG